jgi:Heterokaryon incompatibility protein Het-C
MVMKLTMSSDAVVRTVSEIVSKIPGLEKLLDTISERITLFVMALIAPFIQPVIKAVSASLKTGNNAVVSSSANSQYEVWNDPMSSDPTHSMLSKDHFSNILNDPAGKIASEVVRYVAPRIVYAWEHPDVPVHEVMTDILRVFHHPAFRDNNIEIQHRMYNAVEQWVRNRPGGGSNLNQLLSSESVKAGKNHTGGGQDPSAPHTHSHGGFSFSPSIPGFGSHSKVSGSPFAMFTKKREMGFADEPVGGYGEGSSGQQQGQYQQQQQQPQQQSQQPAQGWNYGQQPGYGQPAYPPQGQSPGGEGYTYTMPTSYQSGYNEYQPPQGGYGQPPAGQYPPPHQGPYGGQYQQ